MSKASLTSKAAVGYRPRDDLLISSSSGHSLQSAVTAPRPGRPPHRFRTALLERIPSSPPAAPAGDAGNVIFHQPPTLPLAKPLEQIPRHQSANVALQLLPQLIGVLIAGVAAAGRQRDLMPAAASDDQAGESGENHGEQRGPGGTRGEADSRGSNVRPQRRGLLPGHVGAVHVELGAEPVQQFPAPAMQDAVAFRIAYAAIGFRRGLRRRDELPLTIMSVLFHQTTIGRDCCQSCCQATGQRLSQVDSCGISAQHTNGDGRPWTSCPLLRIRRLGVRVPPSALGQRPLPAWERPSS